MTPEHWTVRRVNADGMQVGDSAWSQTEAGARRILYAMKAADAVFGPADPAPYGIPDEERLAIMEHNSKRSAFFHALIQLAKPNQEGA